jgi:hypothetical protein
MIESDLEAQILIGWTVTHIIRLGEGDWQIGVVGHWTKSAALDRPPSCSEPTSRSNRTMS